MLRDERDGVGVDPHSHNDKADGESFFDWSSLFTGGLRHDVSIADGRDRGDDPVQRYEVASRER